jgi:two-component system OmpR family sensor kinase
VSDAHEISLDVQPALVEAARDELHRLTINLLENALRHTPAGTEIRVSSDLGDDGQAILVVEDDGPGVPEHLRDTLFERFVRGAGDRGGSFGLGLAIVHAVAESHGGSVTIEPTGERDGEPYGARFVVRLPVQAESLKPPLRPAAPSAAA